MKRVTKEAVLAADSAFFQALLDANAQQLSALLTDDFHIVDVNQGSVSEQAAFISFVASGAVRFDAIDTTASTCIVRLYGKVAVVIGTTLMQFTLEDGTAFSSRSRYTHVFVYTTAGDWQLASAQGTRVEE